MAEGSGRREAAAAAARAGGRAGGCPRGARSVGSIVREKLALDKESAGGRE